MKDPYSKIIKEFEQISKEDLIDVTTFLREGGMAREYVQELRGDARKDAMDLYNHIPKQNLREAYLAAMPQFGL